MTTLRLRSKIHQPVLQHGRCQLSDDLCDLELVLVTGETVRCHGLFLAAASAFFEEQVKAVDNFCTRQNQRIFLPSCITRQSLDSMLEWIYCAETNVKSSEDLLELLVTSTHLDVTGLQEDTMAIVNVSPDNLETLWRLAHKEKLVMLSEKCRRYIATNFQDIFIDNQNYDARTILYGMTHEEIESVLDDDALDANGEELAWEAVRQWLGQDQARMEHLPELLKVLRWPLMHPALLNRIRSHPLLQHHHRWPLMLGRFLWPLAPRHARTPATLTFCVFHEFGRYPALHCFDWENRSWGKVYQFGATDGPASLISSLAVSPYADAEIAILFNFSDRLLLFDLDRRDVRGRISLPPAYRSTMHDRLISLRGDLHLVRTFPTLRLTRYDAQLHQWVEERNGLGDLPDSNLFPSVGVVGDTLYLVGGRQWMENGWFGPVVHSPDICRPPSRLNDPLEVVGRLGVARSGVACCPEPAKRLVVAGGCPDVQMAAGSTRVECFDPNKGTCRAWPSMRHARTECQLLPLGRHRLLALGGNTEGPTNVEMYDARTGGWTDVLTLSPQRGRLGGSEQVQTAKMARPRSFTPATCRTPSAAERDLSTLPGPVRFPRVGVGVGWARRLLPPPDTVFPDLLIGTLWTTFCLMRFYLHR